MNNVSTSSSNHHSTTLHNKNNFMKKNTQIKVIYNAKGRMKVQSSTAANISLKKSMQRLFIYFV